MSGKYVMHSVQFKREAIARMENCRNLSALSRELGICRKLLYEWQRDFAEHGEAGLRSRAMQKSGGVRRVKGALPDPAWLSVEARLAEAERLIGVKQLEVDFLKRTFEHVRGALPERAASGATLSTTASEPGSRSKERI